MSTPDNLESALEGAARFLELAEFSVDRGNWRSGQTFLAEGQAHLEWANEVVATRAKAKERKP